MTTGFNFKEIIDDAFAHANQVLHKHAEERKHKKTASEDKGVEKVAKAEAIRSETAKLARAFDLLAKEGFESLPQVKKAMSSPPMSDTPPPHSGSDNPDVQPPTNANDAMGEQAKETRTGSPHTDQKGTEAVPQTSEGDGMIDQDNPGTQLRKAAADEEADNPTKEDMEKVDKGEEKEDPAARAIEAEDSGDAGPDQNLAEMQQMMASGEGGGPPAEGNVPPDAGGMPPEGEVPPEAAMEGAEEVPPEAAGAEGELPPDVPPEVAAAAAQALPQAPPEEEDPELARQAQLMESYASANTPDELRDKLAQDRVFQGIVGVFELANKGQDPTVKKVASVAKIPTKFAEIAVNMIKAAMGADPATSPTEQHGPDSPPVSGALEGGDHNRAGVPFLESAEAATAFSKRQAQMAHRGDSLKTLIESADDPSQQIPSSLFDMANSPNVNKGV